METWKSSRPFSKWPCPTTYYSNMAASIVTSATGNTQCTNKPLEQNKPNLHGFVQPRGPPVVRKASNRFILSADWLGGWCSFVPETRRSRFRSVGDGTAAIYRCFVEAENNAVCKARGNLFFTSIDVYLTYNRISLEQMRIFRKKLGYVKGSFANVL